MMDGPLAEQLINNLQSGLVLLDRQSRIVAWNTWMTRHSAIAPAQAVGLGIDTVFPEIQHTRLHGGIEQALAFKLSSMLTPGLNAGILPLYQSPEDRAGDRRMQTLIYISPILHDDKCACMIQIQDMTATVRRERRLRAQSSQLIASTYRDPLTGVGNRRRFNEDLTAYFKEARSRQSCLSMLMIDVDHFKAYNDSLGHPQGDACLAEIAHALQDGLRQKRDHVTRYGGEEFAILLADTDGVMATSVAERLRQRVEGLNLKHPNSTASPYVTVSIGVSGFVPKVDQPEHDLISQADLALYMAKEDGRNRVMRYDPVGNEVRAGA
jgi:diguanylate cyclase (GGDEF)-like protein